MPPAGQLPAADIQLLVDWASVWGWGWDGETVIRTLAERTRTLHFAGSQASADSSFSPHAKA
ncbi:hypothetical protein E3A20_23530, partial [Planctomyces bekefii]